MSNKSTAKVDTCPAVAIDNPVPTKTAEYESGESVKMISKNWQNCRLKDLKKTLQ